MPWRPLLALLLIACDPAPVVDAGIDAAPGALDAGDARDASRDATAPRDAGVDTGRPDVGDAGFDAAIPPAPFPDLAIGPYRSGLAIAFASMRSNASALDTSTDYDHSAGQGYLLQAIGELLWAARDAELAERDEMINLALVEIGELEMSADRALGAGPAFGLPDAWDAFGDGSENPAFTAYTWQSGMVALGVAKIARVLEHVGHPELARVRDFGVALVQRWDAHYTSVGDGGYFWYSSQPSDAIAVHNTSALIAMASELLASVGGPSALGRPEACADLLWARMRGNPTTGYAWNYADDGLDPGRRRAEDVSHALVTLQLMRFARDAGWWSDSQMQGVASTLRDTIWTGHPARLTGLVDGTRSADREWAWTRAAAIGYAAHGDAPGGDPWVFEAARAILFSSYLARYDRPLTGATLDSARTLALALLLARRPAAFSMGLGSRWERAAGAGDDATPTSPGGVRFYRVDWSAPAPYSAGIALPSRRATAPNANVLVDLEDTFTGRVLVSITYVAATDGLVQQYDGRAYHTLATLPATIDESGTPRWARTVFALDASRWSDYEPSVVGRNVLLQITTPDVTVHRIEATPL